MNKSSTSLSSAPAGLKVGAVRTSRERRQFLHLPWKIYRDDPNWIPPLRQNQKEMVNYSRHPFYDENPIETFLATVDGEPVGRIAALVNLEHNKRYKEKRGFVGFFECIDNQAVANQLFNEAKIWLQQRGMNAIRGPMNPSMNHEAGLLIDGFDRPPTFMMTYNPAYYQALWENYGFAKIEDMVAFWGHIDMLASIDPKVYEIGLECIRRFNVQLRPLDKRRFAQEVESYLHIYNQALGGTWGFVPMSDAEVRHMAKGLKFLIEPDLTTFAEVDGKPIGAVFGLLDFNPIIKEIDGRLFPFGWWKLLYHRKRLKRVRLITTTVLPEYQRWGISLGLMGRLIPEVKKWGITEGEFSWVLESNHLSYKTLKRGGAEIRQTYRVFDYEVGKSKPSGAQDAQ
ncbi:MAG: hypothetical protein KDA41_08460 [Planctomycetales bacterium]|nr:hypothetical protein [Planctomycetales bacterium]